MTNASPRSIRGDMEKKNCFVKIPSSRFLKFSEDDIVSRNVSDCLESAERIFLTRVQRERNVARNTKTTSDGGRATSTLGTNSWESTFGDPKVSANKLEAFTPLS